MADNKKDEKVVEGTIVDDRTGIQIEKGANRAIVAMPEYQVDLSKVGTIMLEPEEEKQLQEKLNPEDVEIRPDGLIYLPWTWYANKLNKIIGVLRWGNIPQGQPMSLDQGSTILVAWGHWLVIRGIPIGYAIGETSYYKSNYTMSYADACEGAKSISLARNCKLLGMALELWDPSFINEWRTKYGEQYRNEKDKLVWRKKQVKPDPVHEGKKLLVTQLTPVWYKDAKAIMKALDENKLVYSLAEHDEIVRKLTIDAIEKSKKK